MTKRDLNTAADASPAPARPLRPSINSHAFKRKSATDEESNGRGAETGAVHLHAVRGKVVRTYDRNHVARRKPKKTSVYLDIFDFKREEDDEDEGEEDEEDVDDLERFSQALADEEEQIRQLEEQKRARREAAAPYAAAYTRGRGRGRVKVVNASRALPSVVSSFEGRPVVP